MTKKYRNKVPRGSYGSAALLGGFPTTSELDDSWALEFNNVGLVTYSSDPQGWILEFEEVIADQGQTVYIGVKITAPPLPRSRETRFTVYFNHRHNGVLTGYRAVYRDPNLPSNIEPSNDTGVTLVCLLAEIDLSLANDGTYTATTTHRGGTAPFTYNWTLPAGATQVTGLGNSVVTWKGGDGGNVSVTVSDSDAPSPCTDTRTIALSESIPAPPITSGGIALGGYAPAVTRKSTIDTNSLAGYRFADPYAIAPTPADEQWAGINISFWGSEYFCDNSLHRRRVGTQGEIFSEFEVERNYNSLSNSAFDLFLPFYRTETRYELLVRGTYQDRQDPNAVSANARHPRRQTDFNDFDYEYSSDSFFLVVPGKPGAPVDPLIPPIEPPVYPPTGGQHCALSLRAAVINGTDVQFTVETPANYPASGLIKIYRTAPSDAGGISLVKTGNAPTLTLANVESKPALYYATFEPLQSVNYQQGCPTLTSATIGIENHTGPDGCCLPGYYRAVAGAPCIPVPTGPPGAPAAPDAPTAAKNCANSVIVVTAPALPTNATGLQIARDDAPEFVIAQASFEDAEAGTQPRRYRARALNAVGASAWGAYSLTVALVSPLSVEWLAPESDAIVGGLVALRARVVRPAGAVAAASVSFVVDGAAVAARPSPGDGRVWTYLLDTRDYEFQGDIKLAAFVTDVAGCRSVAVARTVRLNASLRRTGSHFDLLLEPRDVAAMLADNRRVSKLALVGEFVRGELLGLSTAHDSFWETRLACPDPGADASLDKFAVARFNKPMLMSGDGMNETARARIIERPVEIAVKWQTGCDRISKIRLLPAPDPTPTKEQLAANPGLQTTDALGVFGRGNGGDRRAAWFRFDEDGLHLSVDLSDADLGDAFDAIQTKSGDVVVCAGDGMYIVDPAHPGDFHQFRKPSGETKPPRAVERAGELVYFWFGDGAATTIYVRDGETLAARGQIDLTGEFVTSFAVRGIVLFCLLDSETDIYHIYRFESGADVPAPTPIYSSNFAVTSLAAFSARAGETEVPPQVARYADLLARWGDESGRVREAATAGVATDVAALGAPVSALGLFRGADLEARGVAGAGASGAGATVWRENGSGIYTPERGWPGALEVSALHRLEITVGKEPDQTFDESLVGGTQGTADDAAFVFRVQQSEPARERGVLVGDLAFRAVGTAPKFELR